MILFNSRGSREPERDDPNVLDTNAGLSFQGSIALGMGFTLTPAERDHLVARNKRNAERIFPYVGGKEVNTSPTQAFHRYVINFGDMSLEEAGRWPDLLAIVRTKVKPERDKLKDNPDGRRRKAYWWQFGRETPSLQQAIRDLPRCLVSLFTTRHLTYSYQPINRIFANTLWVYPLPHHTHFAILQSRIHEPWARLLSSTFGEGLRYAATDCFDTFPFPQADPRAPIPDLETIGRRLYDARAAFMTETDQGLTKTYNALKDPEVSDPRIVELRGLHEEMDRVVLKAYGWGDIAVPPFVEHNEKFSDEIVDRLHVLNYKRSKGDAR